MFKGISNIQQYVERERRDERSMLGVIDFLRSVDGHYIAWDRTPSRTRIIGDTYPIREQLQKAGYTWNRDGRYYEKSGSELGFEWKTVSHIEHFNEYVNLYQRCGYAADSVISSVAVEADHLGKITYSEYKSLLGSDVDSVSRSPYLKEIFQKAMS